jgi:hypothetical protein
MAQIHLEPRTSLFVSITVTRSRCGQSGASRCEAAQSGSDAGPHRPPAPRFQVARLIVNDQSALQKIDPILDTADRYFSCGFAASDRHCCNTR